MRIFAALLFSCAMLFGCLMPVEGGQRIVESAALADSYIDETNPNNSNESTHQLSLVASVSGNHLAPVVYFTLPNLNTGETLDSAHIQVQITVGSVTQSPYHVYQIHSPYDWDFSDVTWNNRNASTEWETPGAWGLSDIQQSLDWGYGPNGHVMEGQNPILPLDPGEPIFYLCRGEYFTDFVEAKLGAGGFALIVHDRQTGGDTGSLYFASNETTLPSTDGPILRLYIHTPPVPSNRRRGMMMPSG